MKKSKGREREREIESERDRETDRHKEERRKNQEEKKMNLKEDKVIADINPSIRRSILNHSARVPTENVGEEKLCDVNKRRERVGRGKGGDKEEG